MITFIWDNILVNPMTNLLIALDQVFFGSFGFAIIAFTLITRAVTFPLTMRQLRSTRAMSELQPRIQELQKKYKDPKRRQEEMMKLYREAGVNPFGCLFPMLIQFPIWIALYQVIRLSLSSTPESYIGLAGRLYPLDFVQHAVPVGSSFLWMDLGRPDFVLPVLVGASMWIQQRSSMLRNSSNASSQQAQMNNTLLWMMPLMFAWFSLTVPSGLALYWFATNLVGIVLNGFVFGFGALHPARLFTLPSSAPAAQSSKGQAKQAKNQSGRGGQAKETPPEAPEEAELVAAADETQGASDGRQRGSKRKNRRRGRRAGPPPARPS